MSFTKDADVLNAVSFLEEYAEENGLSEVYSLFLQNELVQIAQRKPINNPNGREVTESELRNMPKDELWENYISNTQKEGLVMLKADELGYGHEILEEDY